MATKGLGNRLKGVITNLQGYLGNGHSGDEPSSFKTVMAPHGSSRALPAGPRGLGLGLGAASTPDMTALPLSPTPGRSEKVVAAPASTHPGLGLGSGLRPAYLHSEPAKGQLEGRKQRRSDSRSDSRNWRNEADMTSSSRGRNRDGVANRDGAVEAQAGHRLASGAGGRGDAYQIPAYRGSIGPDSQSRSGSARSASDRTVPPLPHWNSESQLHKPVSVTQKLTFLPRWRSENDMRGPAPAKDPSKKARKWETNEERLKQRQKQVEIGKSTREYQKYVAVVPINARAKDDPRTPDIKRACSKRCFDGQLRKWRRDLHKYDDQDGGDDAKNDSDWSSDSGESDEE